MKKELFNELKEALSQSIEHAAGRRKDLRMTVRGEKEDFVLNEQGWREINEKLDAPQRDLPALRELLKN